MTEDAPPGKKKKKPSQTRYRFTLFCEGLFRTAQDLINPPSKLLGEILESSLDNEICIWNELVIIMVYRRGSHYGTSLYNMATF